MRLVDTGSVRASRPLFFFFAFVRTAAFCTRDIAGWRHISRYLLGREALMSWGELSTSHTQSHMLPTQCRHILAQSGMRSGTCVRQHACKSASHTPSLCGGEEKEKTVNHSRSHSLFFWWNIWIELSVIMNKRGCVDSWEARLGTG